MDGLLAVLTMAGFNILYEKMRFRGKNVQAISPPYNAFAYRADCYLSTVRSKLPKVEGGGWPKKMGIVSEIVPLRKTRFEWYQISLHKS